MKIKIPPRWLLSSATAARIKARGEPLDASLVRARFRKLRGRPSAALALTAPAAGDRGWLPGETRSIRWVSEGAIKVDKVGLPASSLSPESGGVGAPAARRE